MAITRVKAAGWGVNEKLSSQQITDVDINAAACLDKRSGQTDTLASTITVTGPLTISAATSHTGSCSFASTVTFGILGTVSFSGAVTFGAASVTTFNGALTVANGATFSAGLTVSGGATTLGGSGIAVNSNLTGDVSSTWLLNGPCVAGNFSLGAANRIQFAVTRSFTRVLASFQHDGQWNPLSNGSLTSNAANPVVAGASGSYVIDDMPDGATLSTVAVKFKPSTTHGGVPATLPSLYVYSTDLLSGTSTLLASGTISTPGSVGAYEVFTSLSVSPGVVVDRTRYKYTALINAESGTNATNSFVLYGAIATFTSAQMDRY